MSGDETKYEPSVVEDELRVLTEYLEQASEILIQTGKRLLELANGHQIPASFKSPGSPALIACGPEQFDIGFNVRRASEGQSPSIMQAGFTVGDDNNAAPRFFVRRLSTESGRHQGGEFTLLAGTIQDSGMSNIDIVDALVEQIPLPSCR